MAIDPGDLPMSPDRFNEVDEPPKPGHGCFYYGCITAIVLAVLMVVAIAISGYFGYQAYLKVVKQYTSPTPMTLPKVEMSKEDREALRGRIEAFKKALDQGEETEPLVLSGDELNVWLAEETEVADRVYFLLEGDKLKGQVSIPLDELGLPRPQRPLPEWEGRIRRLAPRRATRRQGRLDRGQRPATRPAITGRPRENEPGRGCRKRTRECETLEQAGESPDQGWEAPDQSEAGEGAEQRGHEGGRTRRRAIDKAGRRAQAIRGDERQQATRREAPGEANARAFREGRETGRRGETRAEGRDPLTNEGLSDLRGETIIGRGTRGRVLARWSVDRLGGRQR